MSFHSTFMLITIGSALALSATPANAMSSWDWLNEPARRTIIEDINDTTLRRSFDDIQDISSVRAPDDDRAGGCIQP